MKLSSAPRRASAGAGTAGSSGKARLTDVTWRSACAVPQCVQSQASAAGVVRAEPENVSGHRDQRLQVERAGQAVADTDDGEESYGELLAHGA
jgi:hypothetical protein